MCPTRLIERINGVTKNSQVAPDTVQAVLKTSVGKAFATSEVHRMLPFWWKDFILTTNFPGEGLQETVGQVPRSESEKSEKSRSHTVKYHKDGKLIEVEAEYISDAELHILGFGSSALDDFRNRKITP
jgi:hypothetical protein